MPRTCTCWLEQLSELRLHDNKIGDAGAAALASSLQTNARISVLVLGHNEIKELGGASLGTYGHREREKRMREGSGADKTASSLVVVVEEAVRVGPA